MSAVLDTSIWKRLVEPLRFKTQKEGAFALLRNDFSSALKPGDAGFEDARYEVGYVFRVPEGDPQDPDNEEEDDD